MLANFCRHGKIGVGGGKRNHVSGLLRPTQVKSAFAQQIEPYRIIRKKSATHVASLTPLTAGHMWKKRVTKKGLKLQTGRALRGPSGKSSYWFYLWLAAGVRLRVRVPGVVLCAGAVGFFFSAAGLTGPPMRFKASEALNGYTRAD